MLPKAIEGLVGPEVIVPVKLNERTGMTVEVCALVNPYAAFAYSQPSVETISLLHTKKLVRQCLYSYISKALVERDSNNSFRRQERPGNHDRSTVNQPDDSRPYKPAANGADNTHHQHVAQFEFVTPPALLLTPPAANGKSHRSLSSTYPERPNVRDQQHIGTGATHGGAVHGTGMLCDPNSIFKPLEEYITKCFRSLDCLTCSFRPYTVPLESQSSSTQIRRKPVPAPKDTTRPPVDRGRRKDVELAAPPMHDLDPKLLLLGDVAENGQWWLGTEDEAKNYPQKPNKRDNSAKVTSSLKPLQMDWKELDAWYHAVTRAAQGWFTVFNEIRSNTPSTASERELQLLERDLLQGQNHVQRVLLKVTETLLKRPGRCITSPLDLRFLVIILENPLLHGRHRQFEGLMQPDRSRQKRQPPMESNNRSAETASLPSSGPLSGRHSGIIKRVTGLISNAPVDCHNHLIGWWTKYDSPRFIAMKDFFSSFLTYRMLRQKDKKAAPLTDDAVTSFLIPEMRTGRSGTYIHDQIGELSLSNSSKKPNESDKIVSYPEDWQIKAASRVLALSFAANDPATSYHHSRGHQLPSSDFYNSMVDYADLIKDFDNWESKKGKFSFCQYPFLMSIWAKTQILGHDTRREMQIKARDAFLDSIMSHKDVKQYLSLTVRRECLVEDSLKAVSEVIGSGTDDIKKGLRIKFVGEEGIDGGGLRKEWFLLVIRDVFNPEHGMSLKPITMLCLTHHRYVPLRRGLTVLLLQSELIGSVRPVLSGWCRDGAGNIQFDNS